MSAPYPYKIEIAEDLWLRVRADSCRRGRPAKAIFNGLVAKALNVAEAEVASNPTPTWWDPDALVFVCAAPFTLVLYAGFIAGVGVEVHEPTMRRRSHGEQYRPSQGQMLVDWSPWFVSLLRKHGLQLTC